MKVTTQLVDRLSRMAKLQLTEVEKGIMATQLEEILACMNGLSGLETPDGPPEGEGENVLRADEVGCSLDRGQLLANAPVTDGEYILVPNALE